MSQLAHQAHDPSQGDSDMFFGLVLILFTALVLFLLAPFSSYTSAYISAPLEIAAFIEAVDSSIEENESYDRDIAKVQRLDDKLRLGRLLRDIQRCGDDLKEELNKILLDGEKGRSKLRFSARLLWKPKRSALEERVRRADMLRMRFLVVYMGLVTSNAAAAINTPSPPPAPAVGHLEKSPSERTAHRIATRPVMHHAITEGITRKPPLRRLATPAIGHNENVGGGQRMGWAGVIQELQRSPVMHKRHASIETAMMRKTP